MVEHVAPTEAAFLAAAEAAAWRSRAVTPCTLATREAQVVEFWRRASPSACVHALAHPSIVYLLFLVGGAGARGGAVPSRRVVPGLLGVVALVLALMASSALPVRTGALVLLLLGIGMHHRGAVRHQRPARRGRARCLLVLGGVLLVDRFDPDWFVDRSLRTSVPLRWCSPPPWCSPGLAVFLAFRSAQTRRLPQRGGDAGARWASRHRARPRHASEGGEVFVHGERWRAISAAPIHAGAPVVVRRVEGLTLSVDEVKP